MTGRFVSAIVGIALVVSVVAPAAQGPPDVTGLYTCEGVTPDGQPYVCAVEIAMRADQAMLQWRFRDGSAIGVGFVSANVVSVVFQLDNGTIGLASYIITGSGATRRLTGRWTIPGSGMTQTETLTKTAASSLEAIPIDRVPL